MEIRSGYGREQATAGKKQRQFYPNGPCFRWWLGQDTLWPQATRSRPAFLSLRLPLRKKPAGIAQVPDFGSKPRPHCQGRPPAIFGTPVRRYRADTKLSCDC